MTLLITVHGYPVAGEPLNKMIFNDFKAEAQGTVPKLSLNSKVTLRQPVVISNAANACQLLIGKDATSTAFLKLSTVL